MCGDGMPVVGGIAEGQYMNGLYGKERKEFWHPKLIPSSGSTDNFPIKEARCSNSAKGGLGEACDR